MAQQTATLKVPIAGVAATTSGAILLLDNPVGQDLLVTLCIVDVTEKSTVAANLTAGISADGTGSPATVIAAASVAAPVVLNSLAKGVVKWPAGSKLAVQGSASTVGMVGAVHLQFAYA